MTGPGRDVEALRRRLYARGASGADVAAYSAAVEPAPEPATVPEAVVRRRPSRVIVLGSVGIIAAGVLTAALLPHPSAPRRAPLPSPAAVTLFVAERDAMQRNLARGADAGIAAYLISRQTSSQLPGPVPLSIVEGHGTGPGILRATDDPLRGDAGRATVLVVLRTAATVTWSADRLSIDEDHAVRPTPIRREGGAQRAGELTASTFSYRAGERPIGVRIVVPAGVTWGAAVTVGL